MTYHLSADREVEFVQTMRATIELLEAMIEETGGRWEQNGTNLYLDSARERIENVYLEAVTHLGLMPEHERLERIRRDSLFNHPPVPSPTPELDAWIDGQVAPTEVVEAADKANRWPLSGPSRAHRDDSTETAS
jgi:hypothetical protein